MTLKDLFKHFEDKTLLVDLCTPLWRHIKSIKEFESELGDKILDMSINSWSFSNNMIYIDM